MLVTAAVCFAVTFARVASQPIASTSVIILVLYFAGFGSSDRTLTHAFGNVLAYILGGLWTAAISLFLWPVDPFRPARLEVAACYDLLATFTASIHSVSAPIAGEADAADAATGFKRELRARLETARAALSSTAARAPARTLRARNLSVLLETADMLFAATLRLTELAAIAEDGTGPAALEDIAHWLSGAEQAIARELRTRPADEAASFGPDGSHRIEHIARRAALLAEHQRAGQSSPGQILPHLVADERDALQNVEIAFDAVRAVWTGIEPRLFRTQTPTPEPETSTPPWLDGLRQNWTLDSTMLRHALRMAAVGCRRHSRHARRACHPRLLAGDDLHHRSPALRLRNPPQEPTARRRHDRRRHLRGPARRSHPLADRHHRRHHPLLRALSRYLRRGLRLVQLLPHPHLCPALPALSPRLALRRRPHRHHHPRSPHRRSRHAPALAAEPLARTRPPARPVLFRRLGLSPRPARVLGRPPPPTATPPSAGSSPPHAEPPASPARTPKKPWTASCSNPACRVSKVRIAPPQRKNTLSPSPPTSAASPSASPPSPS